MQTQTEIPPLNEKENVALISYALPAEVSTEIIDHLHLTIQEEEEDEMKKKLMKSICVDTASEPSIVHVTISSKRRDSTSKRPCSRPIPLTFALDASVSCADCANHPVPKRKMNRLEWTLQSTTAGNVSKPCFFKSSEVFYVICVLT
jgi:hypothetical protein